MDFVTACEKCGLKAVRHELERRGIVYRFCDDCYWGELEAKEQTEGSRPAKETGRPAAG
jgi:hypothetical protein